MTTSTPTSSTTSGASANPLAEDFIVQLPGVTRNRAEFLEYIAKPRPFKDLAVHDVNIRVLSDVALIHGRSTYTMLADGVEQEALYTDTYQKREGKLGLRCSLRDRSRCLTASPGPRAGRDTATRPSRAGPSLL